MKIWTCFSFLSFVFSSEMYSGSGLKTGDYVKLISEIYDIYQPSKLLLVYFADTDNPSEMNIIFETVLMLSKRGIMTLTVPSEEADPSKNYSSLFERSQELSRTARSMRVILILAQNALDRLKSFTSNINIHVSINLVLFMAKGETSKEFCIDSLAEKFQFNFAATILMKCYNDQVIKQWYPVNTNKRKLVSWAHWEPDTGSTLTIKDSLHPEKGNLGGRILRVATVKSSSLTQWTNRRISGYLGEVLNILEEIMNFTTLHVKEANDFGSWNESTKTWSGAIGLAARGEVDLVLSGLQLTPERMCSVDFSIPLSSTQDTLYVKVPSNGQTITWTGYFQPFEHRIWIAISLILMTSPLVLTLIKMKLKNSCKLSKLISECYLNVWSILCQQGLKEFPTISSLRLAYSSIFVCFFIVMALYSASLISYLTVPTLSLPFTTLQGFVRDGSYNLIVSRDGSEYDMFKESNESIFKKMNELMLPKNELPLTENDGFSKVCKDKVAFYDSEIQDGKNKNNFSCRIFGIHVGQSNSAGMVLSKRSPYKKMLDYHLMKLRSSGILGRLKLKYFDKVEKLKTDDFNSVNISGIAFLLVILAGGILLGVIILLFERFSFNEDLGDVEMKMTIIS